MKYGVIGRGRWGDVWAKTVGDKLAWQAGRDWTDRERPDGIIIACDANSHYPVARACLAEGIPVIIEKPMTLDLEEAAILASMSGIGFTSHPHIYSSEWRRCRSDSPRRVESWSGGACKLDPLWDWGPHHVSLAIDALGVPKSAQWDGEKLTLKYPDGRSAVGKILKEETHFTASVEWVGKKMAYFAQAVSPTPLETLLSEFEAAIINGGNDMHGVKFGYEVVKVLHGANG